MQLLDLWKKGQTGMPLVDANMRELAATGFMSNRGRQNVASYLALDLGIDWRFGADWFEHLLVDHDVSSNWGNWVAAAGLTGGRLNKFNIFKQSKQYDEKGEYLKAWIPELKDVPAEYVHDPSSMPHKVADEIGFQIGQTYPVPIPAKRMQRPHGGGAPPYDGGGGGGRGGGGGGGGGRGKGGRSSKGSGGRGAKQARHAVPMY